MDKRRLMALVLILVALFGSVLQAQTTCRTAVIYRWKPADAQVPQDVVVRSVEGVGADEAAAKVQTVKQFTAAIAEAQDACRRAHENLAGCMSSKFAALAPSLQSATFSSRRTLEEAISADCKKLQGGCLEIVPKEEGCVARAQSSSEGAGGKESSKDKKKK